jgi:ATP-dependent DNA helicase PIF1
MQFSEKQQQAFNKYIAGKNIFISGPGGSGKTALIKHIQQDAYKKGLDVQVCAMTGCAAILLECKAKTLHSWSGIKLGNGTIENMVKKALNSYFLKATWRNIDLLIVDEVSMMSQKIFEMLDAIGKAVRKNSNPFGGIQVIFSGDFYQLPPVGDKSEPETIRFCFESPRWYETFQMRDHVLLTFIFRQDDPVYKRVLNQIREGRLKRSSNELLIQHAGREVPPDLTIRPTKLFPTRRQVDYINNYEMNALKGKEYQYALKYLTNIEMTPNERILRMNFTKEQIQTELDYLKGNLRCDEVVKLKVGAQVMCIVNIKSTATGEVVLCNGSQGIITSLSRDDIPIVKYTNGIEMAMHYHTWPSELIPGVGVAQVPLILAWALTIHKSQGATMDIAEVDAGSGIFECGQTYVALSRLKSLEGLYLSSFDARRIKVNMRVQEFYERLEEYFAKGNANEEETKRDEIDMLPEAYAEAVEVPVVEAIAVPIVEENIDFSQFICR